MNYDPVNRPSHYAEGRRFEVVDVLTDWVKRAPGPVEGSLQWSACKYLGRLWDKQNPAQDARKARWYLDRLIEHLEAPVPFDATGDLYDEVLTAEQQEPSGFRTYSRAHPRDPALAFDGQGAA